MSAEPIEPMEPVIELDDRGRTNLRKFGGRPHGRYLVTVQPDGTLILRPAVVMSAQEAAMWQERPQLMNEIAGHVAGTAPMKLVSVSLDEL
jgi:hypothetical protein